MVYLRSKRTGFGLLSAALLQLLALAALAQDGLRESLFAAADTELEAAQAANAELLAPGDFDRALERYAQAEEDLARGRNIDRIRFGLEEATRLLRQAINSSEIANITLASLIKTRDDARSADAPTFAAELWLDAEESSTKLRAGSSPAIFVSRGNSATKPRPYFATPS